MLFSDVRFLKTNVLNVVSLFENDKVKRCLNKSNNGAVVFQQQYYISVICNIVHAKMTLLRLCVSIKCIKRLVCTFDLNSQNMH